MEQLRDARSRQAYQEARAWSRRGDEVDAVKGLPILIRTQGLMMALALSRKSGGRLAEALLRWLGGGWKATPLPSESDKGYDSFLAAYMDLDPRAAAAVEHEALYYAETLKIIAGVLHGGA